MADENGLAEPIAIAVESVPETESQPESQLSQPSEIVPQSEVEENATNVPFESADVQVEPATLDQTTNQNGGPSSQNGDSHDYDRKVSRSESRDRGDEEKQESEQMRKLFIGGLTFNTTEEDLRNHFGKYGEIVDSVVMVDPQTKKSRCFGFVTYKRASMVDEAQKNRPHMIHDRTVEPKRAIPREMSSKPGSQSTVLKAFVGGVKDGLEEVDLKEYFSKFGNVTSVDIITEKGTTKKRGFAFVTFDDYDPVDKLTLVRNHTVKGFRLETQKAVSKEDMGKDSSSRDRDSYRGGGGRDNYRDRSPPPRDYRERPYGGGSVGRGRDERGGPGGYGGGGGYDDRYGRGRDDRHSGSGYGSRDFRAGSGAGGYSSGPSGNYGSRGGPVGGGWESNSRDYNPPAYGGGYSAPPANSYNAPPVSVGGYGSGGGGGYGQSYGQGQPIQYDNRYGGAGSGGSAGPGYGAGGNTGYSGDYGAGGPVRGGGNFGGAGSRSAPYSRGGGYGGGGAGSRGGGNYGRR